MEPENRVVVLIDMDCFYCQVEEKLNPELKGKPIAVVQYNPWKGGGIIAVNYVARARGVTRHMRGDEAKENCPEIELPSVPCLRGKADISKYRDAGKEVAKVLQRFTPLLERASIDEAYLDITEAVQQRLKALNINTISEDIVHNTFALGYESVRDFIVDVHNYGSDSIEFDYENAKQLLVGAVIVSEIRAAVYKETGYRCSAGIAHNKILAKLVCGMNKPDKQTVLPKHSINVLYSTLSVKKVKHLGGKFGDTVCETLKIKNMGELQSFTMKELQARFDEKNGLWLYNIARGIDLEPVQAKFNPKSIGCCKQFKGKNALVDLDSLKKWLTDLGDEIEDRLDKDALENNRMPKQMVVSFSTSLPDGRDVSSSRSYNFLHDDELCGVFFTNKALDLVMETTEGVKLKDDENNRKLKATIKFLGISVGKFEDNTDTKKTKKIVDYFAAGTSKDSTLKAKDEPKQNEQPLENKKYNNKNNEGKSYILQKFFQINNSNKEFISLKGNVEETSNKIIVETTLEKQESFFERFLNSNTDKEQSKLSEAICGTKEIIHPTTPVCDVLNCGENSNDGTEYSGSTINMEINKSIALFDENGEDSNRISNMRQLLNSTKIINEVNDDTSSQNSANEVKPVSKLPESNQYSKQNHETFQCPECKINITIDKLDTHSDYHLALKLRNEEREQARLERNEKNLTKTLNNEESKRKPTIEHMPNKNEISSIASFLLKIDSTIPTEACSECGKRIQKDRFLEHLDFHEAQKLNRELNKKTLLVNVGTNVKRKRTSTSPVKKPKVACKSIDSFFK